MKKKNEKEFMKIIIMELFIFIISIGALYLFFKYIIFPFFLSCLKYKKMIDINPVHQYKIKLKSHCSNLSFGNINSRVLSFIPNKNYCNFP